jgi:uncharacterized membrane protein YeaQ/YmgE (transglycosylase-associated protein family)
MTLLSFLILLLIAGICGATGQAIVGFRGDVLVSIAIGFIGALIGMWLSGALGMREMFAVNVGGVLLQKTGGLWPRLVDFPAHLIPGVCCGRIRSIQMASLGGRNHPSLRALVSALCSQLS